MREAIKSSHNAETMYVKKHVSKLHETKVSEDLLFYIFTLPI